MDRITSITKNGENVIILNNSTSGIWSIDKSRTSNNTYKIYGFAADRLAAYENTGLTPDEIVEMKAECERLRKLNDTNKNFCGGDENE
ncbi:MAG: hypothetical protein NC401_14545 [Ruminococcus sp.]|nr:hypothetical protein [Ruminococcus sp.]